MSIYKELILDHYKNPRNQGTIAKPDKKIIVHNPLCGDRIEMYAVFDNDTIKKISYNASGCVISKASASLLSEYALKKSKEQLRKLDKAFIINMLGIQLGPNRVKCALLALEALQKLLI